ncbi:Pyridine nucleotide-disulfide oxidoreductase domain-containing protein 1 [Gracilariopsis chorda]|uniref:Pyridine nucleotide-disulfide oxidoreductase domain-containing protein 1 n=1 Tax=Gracilariopsis chorda TaxID=448386 RepID=A0A2V3IVN1_9FLOR|nr:Pyridine nucleotide-disulfide oxidoreductase domain-containing protein 1 [Gracilariopsis chorda]|eukprot:PXF45767.1 Pyridine nucleotide-disulfide oxidoreductase domain-containing protein 1 [Gracilariopsis chorda]
MQKSQPAVVIGGGVAGTTCASYLASLLPNHPIILLEPHPSLRISSTPTEITRLAKDVTVQTEQTKEWCEKYNISHVKAHARTLRPGKVILENGMHQPFSVCCVATGASPFVPSPLQNPAFQNVVITLRDTQSVQSLSQALSGARVVLVVGAGGIAMELVHEITNCRVVWLTRSHVGGAFFDKRASLALATTFNLDKLSSQSPSDPPRGLEVQPKPHSAAMNPEISFSRSLAAAAVGPQWLRTRYAPVIYDKKGGMNTTQKSIPFLSGGYGGSIQALASCEVVDLHKDQSGRWPVVAQLTNGEHIGCDLIIVATGVTANVAWLSDTDIQLAAQEDGRGGGITVKAGDMESSIPCVFAAGDCASVQPADDSDWFQLRLWSQALTAGRAAAQNMAARLGVGEVYSGLEFDVFAHATIFFGKRVVLLGRYNAEGLCDGYKVYERDGEDYLRVVVQGGRVRGAVLVDDTDCAEVFENLILSKLQVDWLGERLVDREPDLEDYFD